MPPIGLMTRELNTQDPVAVVCWLRWQVKVQRLTGGNRVKQQPELEGQGAGDHARHQRPSTTHGVNQPRTRRSVTGQGTIPPGAAGLPAGPLPPRGPGGGGGRRLDGCGLGRVLSEPGPPAERERAADQLPVPSDRAVAADLEVGPAERALELAIVLLNLPCRMHL